MTRTVALALAALMLAAGLSSAQDYPDRAITFIVPQNPGGTTDTLARIFATAIAKELGQEIIVENRPGASTTIGMQAVADADPDGYTLAVSSYSSLSIAPLTHPNIAYDPVEDFEPVFNLANVPMGLVVNSDLGPQSVEELIALAKERPGELNYSSGGTGTGSHFAGAMFVSYGGIADKVVHIPYQGGSQASVAAASGEVQFYVGPLAGNMMGLIDGKEVVPLAVSGGNRVPAIADVPTFAEAGLPEYSAVGWYAIVAPASTPREVVDKLNTAGNAAARSQEVIEALASQGIEPVENTPDELAAQIHSDIESYRKLVKDGIVVLE